MSEESNNKLRLVQVDPVRFLGACTGGFLAWWMLRSPGESRGSHFYPDGLGLSVRCKNPVEIKTTCLTTTCLTHAFFKRGE